jgi:hypothetical protein
VRRGGEVQKIDIENRTLAGFDFAYNDFLLISEKKFDSAVLQKVKPKNAENFLDGEKYGQSVLLYRWDSEKSS